MHLTQPRIGPTSSHAIAFRLPLGPTGSPILSRSHTVCAADELIYLFAKWDSLESRWSCGVETVGDSLWEHSGHVIVVPFYIVLICPCLAYLVTKRTLGGPMNSCPNGGAISSLVPGRSEPLGRWQVHLHFQY